MADPRKKLSDNENTSNFCYFCIVFLFINNSIQFEYKVTLLVLNPQNRSYVFSANLVINLK